MDIKTKLIKLESGMARYVILTVFFFWSLIQGSSTYSSYTAVYQTYPSIGREGYLRLTYMWGFNMILCLALITFLIIIDATVKKKERYLIIDDNELFIPNAITKKIKNIKIKDIKSITYEGITQDRIKINMESTDFFILPRIYGCYEMELEEIYKLLNKRLVEVQTKDI